MHNQIPLMRKLIVAVTVFFLTEPFALACDGALEESDAPRSSMSIFAESVAVMPMLAAGNACALLTLPADIYWHLEHPEQEFGAYAANSYCTSVAEVVGCSIYNTLMLAPQTGRDVEPADSADALPVRGI